MTLRASLTRAAALACLGFASLAAQADTVVSSGTLTLEGTWTYDLDAGVLGPNDAYIDIYWGMENPTVRFMYAVDEWAPGVSSGIVGLGAVDFNSLTAADLAALTYTIGGALDGSDASNVLVPGYVFAVHTTDGNYAKVLVTGAFSAGVLDNGLPMSYVTYGPSAPVPEPENIALMLAGLGVLGAAARRRG